MPGGGGAEDETEYAKRNYHPGDSGEQQRASAGAVDEPHGNERHNYVYQTNSGGGKNGAGRRGNARGANDLRGVVNHGVDSGDLLKYGEANSYDERWANGGLKQVGPSAAFVRL